MLRSRLRRDEGQTMAEYGVVLAVITPAIVLAIGLLSGTAAALFDRVRALFGG